MLLSKIKNQTMDDKYLLERILEQSYSASFCITAIKKIPRVYHIPHIHYTCNKNVKPCVQPNPFHIKKINN